VIAGDRVYLLSGPVRTGKTTRIQEWCKQRNAERPGSVRGVLAPVVDGHRHLVSIQSGEARDLELIRGGTPKEPIGRFVFNGAVFEWARGELLSASQSTARWIVIDEIGPLELAGRGLEPSVTRVLQSNTGAKNVVIVVREQLASAVVAHFRILDSTRFQFA